MYVWQVTVQFPSTKCILLAGHWLTQDYNSSHLSKEPYSGIEPAATLLQGEHLNNIAMSTFIISTGYFL